MNILVIGNGFDLAHGLPTKYIDFLEWVKAEYALYLDSNGNNALIEGEIWVDWAIKSYPSKISVKMITDMKVQIEIWKCINKNFWIDYFLNNLMYQKENWIDFESEISKVVKSIDDDMLGENFYGKIDKLSNKYLDNNILYKGYDSLFKDENGERGGKREITYKQLRDIMINDLNRLIQAFEIYLNEYVEKIYCTRISPDIKNMNLDNVLCFNYTNTFERLYDKSKLLEYDYIHGKADINNTTNNMVLGIDEYLPDDRKNKDLEFIAFKKYYQRIFKETGSLYKKWIEEIQRNYEVALQNEANYIDMMKAAYNKKDQEDLLNWYMASSINRQNKNKKHNLYIFGHSLAKTDGDIIRNLILNDNVYTTIYYPDKEELGRKIANLVKVIGQDELIRRTGGSTKTIQFVLQKPMEKIENV